VTINEIIYRLTEENKKGWLENQPVQIASTNEKKLFQDSNCFFAAE
jgi:hypothetical protein